jgi:ketosteroid isomerase-like protein
MRPTLGWCLLATAAFLPALTAVGSRSAPREEIEAFNQRYLELHQKMDTAGVLALWAEDGVDLMPEEAPIVGKKAIVAWVEGVEKGIAGYKVAKEELDFHDIQVAGEWASEWATEHQVVQEPDGRRAIETYGKIALVLHREPNGAWKVRQEMWNASPKP